MPANPQVTDVMVEKAARAICLAEGYDPKELDTIGSYSHQELWKDGRPKARSALEAALADHVVGWRDIESAPKDGSLFLAYNVSHDEQVVVGWTADPHMPGIWPDGCWTDVGNRNRAINYTVNENYFQLWQPLPASPLVSQEG